MKLIVLSILLLLSLHANDGAWTKDDLIKNKSYCDEEDGKSCARLATAYKNGHVVKKNLAQALKYFDNACHFGYTKSCIHLGKAYSGHEELGVKRDYAKAKNYFKKACDRNLAEGCTYLGNMYAEGQGTEKDTKKALSLFRKACDKGYDKGCKNYEMLKERSHQGD